MITYKNQQKKYPYIIFKVKPTINNFFITLTDKVGNVVLSKNAGSLKFKGRKKKSPYVAGLVMEKVLQTAQQLRIKLCSLELNGFVRNNVNRTLVKKIAQSRIKRKFFSIQYKKLQTHNGVRKSKKRRI